VTLFKPIKVCRLTLQHRRVVLPPDPFPSVCLPCPLATASILLFLARFPTREAAHRRSHCHISHDAGMSQVSAPTHKSKAGRRSRMPSMQRDLPPTLLADVDFLEKQGPPSSYVSASSVALTSLSKPPRPLTEPEIQDCIAAYAKAASSAVHGVGFDGVEIHNANGYLLDQFLQTVYNKRTDKWGGDKQRRTRFAQADRGRCGPRPRGYSCQSLERSPRYMGMPDPRLTFAYLLPLYVINIQSWRISMLSNLAW
jgi:NADPH2 dehydrogenase